MTSSVPQPGRSTMCLLDHRHTVECAPIPRGETEELIMGYGKPRRKRRTFTQWWASFSHVNDVPDFLTRKDD